MKLHPANTRHYQTVTAYDADSVSINAVRFTHSLLVMPESAPVAWPVENFEALQSSHFDAIAALSPDVVILGTGARQRFVHPRLVAGLAARGVGVESMDAQAACRTYNLLMQEGRKVVLALILDRAA
ncbi:Mth938-like domain-containing protein [Massilia sp. TS11]|uniref:Mth938-like domain-containing protein n=1 Tax=Massilia sp. TS11 TaxID=2908003 RepID=UPI001EDBBDC9|nr:Mth938-like domain-containing protein [Massilia sp. TS11]MCG2583045.1 Mth938-like domain-containing protein [Massilia sp. TS11]